jgi:hypothetical protein
MSAAKLEAGLLTRSQERRSFVSSSEDVTAGSRGLSQWRGSLLVLSLFVRTRVSDPRTRRVRRFALVLQRMAPFFSSSNRDWQPALVLYSWSNRLERPKARCIRDPTKQNNYWRDRAALLIQLILIHLYRVLSLAGLPFAGAFRLVLSSWSGLSAAASEVRRLTSAFVGWQNQRISRRWNYGEADLLSGLRRWHVTLGAKPCRRRVPASATQRWQCRSSRYPVHAVYLSDEFSSRAAILLHAST